MRRWKQPAGCQQAVNCCAVMLLALQSPALLAGEFNHKSLLTGERAAGLGGAYVALSDDSAGMFYNPAGLVHAQDLQAKASVNLISSTVTKYSTVFGQSDYQRESLEIVPGMVGGLTRRGRLTLGASLVVADSLNEDQSEDFTNVVIGNDPAYDDLMVQNDYQSRTYDMGVSAAWPFSESFSFGATLYLHYRDRDASLLQRASRDLDGGAPGQDRDAIIIAASSEDTEIGLRPLVGLQYRSKRVAVGLAASRMYPFHRDYRYSFIGDGQTDDGNLALSFVDAADSALNGPWHLAGGLAWFRENGAVFSLQLDYYQTRKAPPSVDPGRVPPRDLETEAVLNLALGLEVPWSQHWHSRFGVYTNAANNRVAEAAPFERREEIDMYGLTFSLTRLRDEAISWTVGVQLAFGDGDATLGDIGFGGAAVASAAVEAERQRVNLFVSTSF